MSVPAPASRHPLADDPKLAYLVPALDPHRVQEWLAPALARYRDAPRLTRIRSVRLRRHKPGRRCLFEFELDWLSARGEPEQVTLFGKVRSRGLDQRSFDTQQAVWQLLEGRGLGGLVRVPEPLVTVPELGMWIQRKSAGFPAASVLMGPTAPTVARRIAAALATLQAVQAPADRTHSLDDELGILRDRLGDVARSHPWWSNRLLRIIRGCERLAAGLPHAKPRGIHRDFYPDQVLVSRETVTLLDLDLYCHGDLATDAGNFLAHMIERRMRDGVAAAIPGSTERAFLSTYLELMPEVAQSRVEAHVLLSLARHVSLSTQLPGRGHTTERLIHYCETHLGV